MNSIQLTEEHKSKVLEMCKALFPEYKVKFILDSLLNYDDRIFNYLSIEEITEGEVDFTVIHWFEFCITWLLHIIIYRKDKWPSQCKFEHQNILMEIMKVFYNGDGIHPIDYLYNEFKKLK